MADIVKRLREHRMTTDWQVAVSEAHEAADEIERLRAALGEMLEDWDNLDPDFPEMRVAKARAALNTEKEKQG